MKYIILGHENPDVDSLVTGYLVEKIIKKYGYEAEFIIPDLKVLDESYNLCCKYGLDIKKYQKELNYVSGDRFILVDHHERDVPGEIFAIVDHHPVVNKLNGLGNISYYVNEKACSTSCLLIRKYINELSEKDLKLACLAAFVDTASFHSTKTVDDDVEMIQRICKQYNFNYEKLYKDGLCLTDISNINEACFNGLKKYNINDYQIYASSIQIIDIKSKTEIIDNMIEILKKYLISNKIYMYVFILYDMNDFKTIVYKISLDSIEIINYNEYASRGNTIIPDIKNSLIR